MKNNSDASIRETENQFINQTLLNRLVETPLYRSFGKVFQEMTGLPLELQATTSDQAVVCRESRNPNRFCHLINQVEGGCEQCLMSRRCLSQEGNLRVQSIKCFAGMQETSVPLVLRGKVIAHLKTGKIFYEKPSSDQWEEVKEKLGEVANDSQVEGAYMEALIIDKEKYQAMLTMLAAFSLQLRQVLKQLETEIEKEENSIMALALDYIEEHLGEAIHLENVAEHLNMSTFHFCRKFKESIGVTLTSYVAQLRVDYAKEALLQTNLRITDIAFDVGFQSLSQFNRSFHKLTGQSPTRFREERACASVA